IRHVIIPSITLNEAYLKQLRKFIDSLKTVEKIEALPYHTMGATKYKNLGIVYPLEGILPPTKDEMEFVKKILRIEEQGEEK
ncbi:MAG: hypothetical protein K2J85_02670, partial [Anaeroplasmataceae bacterium]|nr:hypothetical protein [Anaeroplasmataceae bacterium]